MLRRTSYNWCAVLHGDGPWWCVGRSPWAWCAAVCWAEPCAWGLQTAGQTTGRRPEGDRIVRSGVTHRQKMASAQLPPTNSLPSGEARGVWVSTQPTWWAYWHSFSIVQAGDTLSRGLISPLFSPAFDHAFDHLQLIRATFIFKL